MSKALELETVGIKTEHETLADLSESILAARIEDWIEKNA